MDIHETLSLYGVILARMKTFKVYFLISCFAQSETPYSDRNERVIKLWHLQKQTVPFSVSWQTDTSSFWWKHPFNFNSHLRQKLSQHYEEQ